MNDNNQSEPKLDDLDSLKTEVLKYIDDIDIINEICELFERYEKIHNKDLDIKLADRLVTIYHEIAEIPQHRLINHGTTKILSPSVEDIKSAIERKILDLRANIDN